MKGRLQTSRRPLKAILPRPQAYTTSTPSAPYSPDAERSTQPVSSPEKTSSNGHRTQRLRTGTNKALPLPPVIDPIVVSAKQRWREPKSDPDRKTFTDFQKKLYRNPFGALSPQSRFMVPTASCKLTSDLAYCIQPTPSQLPFATAQLHRVAFLLASPPLFTSPLTPKPVIHGFCQQRFKLKPKASQRLNRAHLIEFICIRPCSGTSATATDGTNVSPAAFTCA